mmetsp:Transcript_38275/g.101590  ORF Transcript_38275/g.101590 Transcript_38275/m.101590 type:complete len:80 (-) Transcript_38275:433-672(-)
MPKESAVEPDTGLVLKLTWPLDWVHETALEFDRGDDNMAEMELDVVPVSPIIVKLEAQAAKSGVLMSADTKMVLAWSQG